MNKILLIVQLSSIKSGIRNAGGVDSVCQMIVNNLAQDLNPEFHYRIVAFNPFNDGEIISNAINLSEKVEIVYYPSKFKKFGISIPGLLSCNFIIAKQVSEFKPDIVHSHIGAWIAGAFKVKHRIATLHSHKKLCRNPKSFFNDLLYEKIMPWVTDLFVTEYTVVGDLLLDALTKDTSKKISVIPNPISNVFFRRNNHVFEKNINTIKIVTCALITRRKRIDLSIKFLEEVRNAGINAELFIIGPHIDKGYVEELIINVEIRQLNNYVHFVGACSQNEIVEFYSKSHIGIFFSAEESFGLAPLEMIACSLPVITSKVGVISDRIANFDSMPSVLVIEEFDFNEVPKILLPLVNSDVSEAKSFIEKEYSIDYVKLKYESLYRQVLL